MWVVLLSIVYKKLFLQIIVEGEFVLDVDHYVINIPSIDNQCQNYLLSLTIICSKEVNLIAYILY